jgi:hypothetical protein
VPTCRESPDVAPKDFGTHLLLNKKLKKLINWTELIPTPTQTLQMKHWTETAPDNPKKAWPLRPMNSHTTQYLSICQAFESQSQDSINNDHTPIDAERPSNWHLMSGRAKNNWRKNIAPSGGQGRNKRMGEVGDR